MSNPVFDYVCDQLEARTELDRLSARGTVRILLKDAGLEPATVGKQAMATAIHAMLPKALADRGIAEGQLAGELERGVLQVDDQGVADTAVEVFSRLGG